jgi:hypothetical protein
MEEFLNIPIIKSFLSSSVIEFDRFELTGEYNLLIMYNLKNEPWRLGRIEELSSDMYQLIVNFRKKN